MTPVWLTAWALILSVASVQAKSPPDYQWFCLHKKGRSSYYVDCSTKCRGEPICCDANLAKSTTAPGSGGKRCMKTRYGAVDATKCAGKDVPSSCPYEFFCKHNPSKASYYKNCDLCKDTPICCNTDATTLTTNAPNSGGKRCKVGYKGHADLFMCQARTFPSICPLRYQYLCKHDLDSKSYHSDCNTCVGEPICSKKGSKEEVSMDKCADLEVPQNCPYQYFCKHDLRHSSYTRTATCARTRRSAATRTRSPSRRTTTTPAGSAARRGTRAMRSTPCVMGRSFPRNAFPVLRCAQLDLLEVSGQHLPRK